MNKTTVAQQAKAASSLSPAQGILQRKCACGNHTVAGGECAECAKNNSGLQRKLTIGASNDPLEQEADRVADQVMAAPAHSAVSGAPPRIQRYAGQTAEGAQTAPASVDRILASSGRPLDAELRQDMEARFGHDFSRVRVHTGAAAEQSARDVNAHAYTVGHNIVFDAGRFAPVTPEGRRLIAHELTHVAQQSTVGNATSPLSSTGPKVQRRFEAPLTRNLETMSDAELSTEAQRVRAWLKTHGAPDLDYFPTVEYLSSIEAEQSARNTKVEASTGAESEVPFGPPRPPVPMKPGLGQLPWNRYVDNFLEETYYDINYKVEQGYSDIVRVVYDDGTMLEINVRKELVEKSMTSEAGRDAMALGTVGRGGRIFPTEMTSRTAPRLWALREQIFEDQDKAFAKEAEVMTAVTTFILSVPAMPAGAMLAGGVAASKPRVTSRPGAAPVKGASMPGGGTSTGAGKAITGEVSKVAVDALVQTFRKGEKLQSVGVVSLKRLRNVLGRAGVSPREYKLVKVSKEVSEAMEKEQGQSIFGWVINKTVSIIDPKTKDVVAHKVVEVATDARGRPIIYLAPRALSSLEEAVKTFGHEAKHLKDYAAGITTSSEALAEKAGEKLWLVVLESLVVSQIC